MRIRARAAASLLWVVLAILAGLAPTETGAYDLNEVSLTWNTGETMLDLVADETIRYDVFQLQDPPRVVLDLLDAETDLVPNQQGGEQPAWVSAIDHSLWRDQPDGRIVRYVIHTTDPVEYGVMAQDKELRLCVTPISDPAVGPELPNDLADAIRPDPSPESAPPLDLAPPLGKADPSYVIAAVEVSSSKTNPNGGGAPISLDVQGADIRTVLRSIAEFGHINIVPDREISGSISLRLDEVPWRMALDLVCASAALTAVDNGEVIRVAKSGTLIQEEIDRESSARKREDLLPLETAVYRIQYANAEELRQSVSFVLSKRGSAEVDERTNAILVTDIAERLALVRTMIEDLDSETLQVEIVAKLVDVDATLSRQLGISWSASNLHSNGERLSATVQHDSPLATATTDLRFGVVRSFMNVDATIQALARENKANIISNPSITTVNNRKARILVGKEVPLIVLDESGNPITELYKVGITLEVTPYINSEDRVTMDLHPEVSDLSSQATVQGGIVFTKTEADTRVMVRNGETAVIGGLIRTNDTTFEQGIPLLRSIPILGNLFKSSDVRKDRRELLIFVTPRIVRGMASIEPD